MEKIFVTSKNYGKFFNDNNKTIQSYLDTDNICIDYYKGDNPIKEEELIREAKDAIAIINYSNMDEITTKAIESLPKLKIIARHGIGYDHIAVSYTHLDVYKRQGYDTPGYGYGVKDEDGTPLLQKKIAHLAQEYNVPYIVDNAWGCLLYTSRCV